MERTLFSDIDFQIRRMTEADYENMSGFSCGVEELDDFFRHEVKECVDHRYLSAYCVLSRNEEIIAAFTLMNDALMIGSQDERKDFFDDLRWDVGDNIVDFFKRQTSFPAINIGHLGTSVQYQNNGIGMIVIAFVTTSFSNYHNAGCQFITVDALNNPRTLRFYCNNGFSFQTNRDMYSATRRMFRII